MILKGASSGRDLYCNERGRLLQPGAFVQSARRRSFRSTNPQIIGLHIYECDDGAKITVDFFADGLTIEMRSSTGGKPARLAAPGQGLRYIGDRITADATGGPMTINRQGHAARACRRI